MIVRKLFETLVLIFFISACNTKVDDKERKDEPYEIVKIESDWFSVSYLEPKTYIIEEPKSSQKNVSYLILGTESAIMIDTGSGENKAENGYKIKKILNKLTHLPVKLVLSHFHFDHSQNISEFNYVVFPELQFLKDAVSADQYYTFTKEDLFIGNYPKRLKVNDWWPVNKDIDLGNRIIQLINVPGHTKESIAIIDKTYKKAYLGDYLYNGSLFIFDINDVAAYKKTTEYLISILDKEYRLYGAHGTPDLPFTKLSELNDFLHCILTQNCEAKDANLWGYQVAIYKHNDMSVIIFK